MIYQHKYLPCVKIQCKNMHVSYSLKPHRMQLECNTRGTSIGYMKVATFGSDTSTIFVTRERLSWVAHSHNAVLLIAAVVNSTVTSL